MDLQGVVRETLLRDVIRATHGGAAAQWRVLVVDQLTIRVVSKALHMHQLAQEKVLVVEQLEVGRSPHPALEAIYYLAPTEAGVAALTQDLLGGRYAAAHVYFSQPIPDRLFHRLAESPACTKFLALKEVNLAFVPVEPLVYSLGSSGALGAFHVGEEVARRAAMEEMADRVAGLCTSLGEMPAIRYREESEHTADLANMVQARLDALKAEQPDLRAGGQLLLLDRAFDPVTPLVHDVTVQAMAADLNIGLEDGLYKYEQDGEERKAVMDETNKLWVEVRYKHFIDAVEVVNAKQKELAAYAKQIKEGDAKGMKTDIKKLPKYEQDKRETTALLDLLTHCMEWATRNKDLLEVEQAFATGQDEEGRRLAKPMSKLLSPLINPNISTRDKVRIILLYAISEGGISKEDLDKIIVHGKLSPAEAAMIRGFEDLGVPIIRQPGQEAAWKLQRKARPAARPFMRWTPVLMDLVEQAMDGKLSDADFPLVRPEAGAAARYGQFNRKTRMVVFVVGGVSLGEARVGQQLAVERAKDWEVVVGGSTLLTPSSFLREVAAMEGGDTLWEEEEKEPLLSRAQPNGQAA